MKLLLNENNLIKQEDEEKSILFFIKRDENEPLIQFCENISLIKNIFETKKMFNIKNIFNEQDEFGYTDTIWDIDGYKIIISETIDKIRIYYNNEIIIGIVFKDENNYSDYKDYKYIQFREYKLYNDANLQVETLNQKLLYIVNSQFNNMIDNHNNLNVKLKNIKQAVDKTYEDAENILLASVNLNLLKNNFE